MNTNSGTNPTNKSNIFNTISSKCQLLDEFILTFYLNFTTNFDSIILNVDLPPFIKKILHSKQILFFLVLICNYFLISNNTKLEYSSSDLINVTDNFAFEFKLKNICYSFFKGINILLIMLILLLKLRPVDDMYIKRNEGLEKHILLSNNELSNNQCDVCLMTRCMRSYHCTLCNKCVAKFELHSDWFHICIGSMNLLPYLIILFFLNFYFIIILFNLSIQIFIFGRLHPLYDYQRKEFIFHFWILIHFYFFIKTFLFTSEFAKMGIMKNLTDYEGFNWKRLPYLWKNMRKEYFNPFDKGLIGNLKELWASFINKEIQLSDRINLKLNSNVNLNDKEKENMSINGDDGALILVMDKKEENRNESEKDGTQNPNQNKRTYEKVLEPFITDDNKFIYRQYTGREDDIINWTRVRFYTIFDLNNSPFRDIVLKQLQMNC